MAKPLTYQTATSVLDHHFRSRPEGTLLLLRNTLVEATSTYRMSDKGMYLLIDGLDDIVPGSKMAYPDEVARWAEANSEHTFQVVELAR
jgi:hypothetical protein